MNNLKNRKLSKSWLKFEYIVGGILGIVLAWIWDKTKSLVEGKTAIERAYKFGLAYWVIAGIPGMFITYSSFQVSLAMIVTWSFSGLVEAVVAGWIFAKKNP